ncbi:LOW QUALITY PROTEIN: uncharacterized protein [Amphiura filiformis]|uniref:LOW QUALITY PROTEIN: uncharacterized protein n=1 Tax=Amphiura filiformis TaxID=82378 RepID=UPI003B2283F3
MSTSTESTRASWYVILPPPVELGPCVTHAYRSKRSSQSSIVSTASSVHKLISESPNLSDSTATLTKENTCNFVVERDKTDNVVTMSDGNRPQNGVNDDVNGNESFEPSAGGAPELADSGLDSSAINSIVDLTGGISREQFPEDETQEDEDEQSGRKIDISDAHSDKGEVPDERRGDQRVQGGLQVGQRERHQNVVQEVIAEVSAECAGGNLSISLSQHSMESTSSSELAHMSVTGPPESQTADEVVRPETIISPLQSETESVSERSSQFEDVTQAESLHKDAHYIRTSDSQIPKMESVEGHESPQQISQTLLSEHTMEDTTQAGLSEHPMEDTTQPTISQYPIDDSTEDANELSEYLIDKRDSLETREEPIGQHRLMDSNENIIGTESESYTSSHSDDASTVVRTRHVEGESGDAQVGTTQSASRPSSSASSVRSLGIAAEDSSQRSQEGSMTSKDVGKDMESGFPERKISDSTTTSAISGLTDSRRESGAGDMSEDSIGPRRCSDQSVKIRGSQVKLPLDLNMLASSVPNESQRKDQLGQETEVDGPPSDPSVRKRKIDEVRSDSETEMQRSELSSRDVPSRNGASYIQYPPSLQSQTPSETSRRDVQSRSSALSQSRDSSRHAASSKEGVHGHDDDRVGLLRKETPEGAEADDEDRKSQMSSQSGSIPVPSGRSIPPPLPTNGATGQDSNTRAYLNLEDLQTQDALADRVALLLGDAIVTSLSRDRPGVGDGGSSSEAGTPDSIETEKSERASVSRDPHRDEHGFPQQLTSQDPPSSSRSGTSIGSFADSLADRVAQILAGSDAMRQLQAYQASAGGIASPTPSDVSTSSSVRAIIDKVLQKTATGMGYVSGDDASSICSDIPPHPSGRNGFEFDTRQTMSPRHVNLSHSMSVPLGSPHSPESARRTPSPTRYRDDSVPYSPRSTGPRGSFGSYQTTDTLDHQVQNLLTHTAYMDQAGLPPAYSPGRESPRLIHGRQSPLASPRLTTFDRIRQGDIPVRRHSATGIPRPVTYPPSSRTDSSASYGHPSRADSVGGGDQGFYLRMEPEGRSSLSKRPGQPGSHIPVAAGPGRTSPSTGYVYRRTPDRRSTELIQTLDPHLARGQHFAEPSHSPRGLYADSPESMDSLAHRVQAILAGEQSRERANQFLQDAHPGDMPLPEGGLQAAWHARAAAGQLSSSARASIQSSPYSSRRESPRASQHNSPRTGSPRGWGAPMDAEDDYGMPEYGAFDRARNLLSNQMQRVTDMTFDHSVDVRDPFTNRLIGRGQPRRGNGQDQYVQSGLQSPRGSHHMSTSPRGSPLMSPHMHPQSGWGSRYPREAWGEDYQHQDDFQQPLHYGSLPDNESPGLPDDKDSQHFFPLKPQYSPTKAFQPVPQQYGSLPRSFHKTHQRYPSYPQGAADYNLPFAGSLPRSVSNPDIDIDPPRSPRLAYARQVSERIQRSDHMERDSSDIKYKTWETDVRAAQARMSPRPDRATSIPVAIPGSPREFCRNLSRDSDALRSPDHRMSPRSFTKPPMDHQYTLHTSQTSKVVSPLGRDIYGASNIRAYRPPGSTEVSYTYPLGADESLASNQTTMESSHPGSDDAQPPAFPPGSLGSRRDPHLLPLIPHIHSLESQDMIGLHHNQTKAVEEVGVYDSDRNLPARSYVEYPSDLKSTDESAPDGSQVYPESQQRSRPDDRYQECGPHTGPETGARVPDIPQSQSRTQYSGIPGRQDITRGPEYARLPPHSSDATNVVRDLPPVHPSARVDSGYRRASDSIVRASGLQHGGGTTRFGQQSSSEVPRPAGNYSRRVLQDVLQNESNPRYAEIGQAWEEYERFRTNTEGSNQSSLDSEKIRQVADLLEDPVKHTVTRWAKLDESDTQSESSYDSRTRRRKRWEKEQPFSPAHLNNSYNKEHDAKQQQSVDQSTTMETTYARQSSTTSEEESQLESKKTTKKPETKEQHPPQHHQKAEKEHRPPQHRQKTEKERKNGEDKGQRQESKVQRQPSGPDESAIDDSSLTSVDTLLSDLSLESDQLYRLLGAQGVRKLSSKLVNLQNKIDRQKEHHRKRDEQSRKHGAPKMASTPAQLDVDSNIQKVVDTVKGSKSNGHVLSSAGHMLSPVAERSQETIEMSSQITFESAVSDHEPKVEAKEKPVKPHRKHILTERQLKKLERRKKHKYVNYRDDFHISYGSEAQSDSVSEGSVPCTCRPRRTQSLQDVAPKLRSKAAVTIEPKSHVIRKGTFRKTSTKGGRLPSRIPVHCAEDIETRDMGTNYPSPAAQRTAEERRPPKGTAFTITFKSDKRKGKDGKQQAEEEDAEENGKRKKRLQYRHRGTADGEGSKSGTPEPVAWFQPFSKKMPWQQDVPRKPLADTQPPADLQPPALKREGTKTVVKLSLQEAFEEKRAEFISRSRERQKKLQLAAEERQTEIEHELERNRLFQDKRQQKVNAQAHPYSDQLHKPQKRRLTKKEIKEQTQRLYAQLPEVLQRNEAEKRLQTYESNRLKAQVYRKKLSDRVKGKGWSET